MWFNQLMGIKQIITDDLTDETLTDEVKPTDVRVDGEDYSVYLSDESKETFIAFLKGEAPLLKRTSRIPTAPKKKASTGSGTYTVDTYGYPAAEVRAWAKKNKVSNIDKNGNEKPVGDVGRLTQNVYDAYKASKDDA